MPVAVLGRAEPRAPERHAESWVDEVAAYGRRVRQATALCLGCVRVSVTTVSPSSSGLQIRPAERADLAAVHRIEQTVFPQPWPAGAFERFLGKPGFLVAEDGLVVGYIVADIVESHGRTVGHIKDLAVRTDRRREGIGSTLLVHALEVLSGHVGTVKLEVREGNEGAIGLYRRHGFSYRRRLPGYYADGEDGLVFTRTLQP